MWLHRTIQCTNVQYLSKWESYVCLLSTTPRKRYGFVFSDLGDRPDLATPEIQCLALWSAGLHTAHYRCACCLLAECIKEFNHSCRKSVYLKIFLSYLLYVDELPPFTNIFANKSCFFSFYLRISPALLRRPLRGEMGEGLIIICTMSIISRGWEKRRRE